jgi:pimeloyl-ACP methyl ester carboxylesterase
MAALVLASFSLAPLARAQPVALKTPTGTLNGTLELPKGAGPFPVVLFHAGSGPTDRDGNNPMLPGKNDMFKMLAEALASRGMASVRFDKRGIGGSSQAGPSEADLRFDTYITDLTEWGKTLAADKRFSKLIVLGHSEGALIGAIAAGRISAAGFISIAGTGRPAGQLIVDQMRDQVRRGAPPALVDQVSAIVKSLENNTAVSNIPGPLQALFRDSVQPYLISWFKYDPVKEYARLKMPMLILQGTTDIQVTVDDARLLSSANRGAKLVILEGANHLLKPVTGDLTLQLRSYGDPNLPVTPKAIDEIADFVRGATR